MSADQAGRGSSLKTWCRQLCAKSLRQILSGAIAISALASGTLSAQQASEHSNRSYGQIQPVQMQRLQLDAPLATGPAVSGQVDAIHSPNVDRLLKPQYNLELEKRHSQLVMTNRNIRRIAVTDSTIANYVQYSPTEVSVVGMELGKTDLTFWFEDEEMPSIYEVSVINDASLEDQRTLDFGRLERRLKMLFPNSQVAIIPVGTQVLVRGQAYDGEEAQNILQIVRAEVFRTMGRNYGNDNGYGNGLNNFAQNGNLGGAGGGFGGNGNGLNNGFRDIVINELSVPGEYNVMMRVIVAEINRSQMRNFGFDWQVAFHDSRHTIGGALGGGTGTTLSGIFENGEIAVLVRWLQSNGTVKLLAEPTVTCMSGTSSSILAGGEFAVPTIIGLGGGQATSFRGFGTSLVVTPTVMDRDLIRLQVVPEFSELNANNTVNGIPGTNVKRVQTTVELREGQTFAIGGLLSRQELSNVSRIPLLGDIPYLGPKLFQSKNASEVETELLVLVSPEIVRPMEPDEVPPLPGFNHTHPNDYDLWHLGRTEGTPDNNVYQVGTVGSGSMYGVPVGYSQFNPPVGLGAGLNGGGMPMQGGSPLDSGAQYGAPMQSQTGYSMPQSAVNQGQQAIPTPPTNTQSQLSPASTIQRNYPPQSNVTEPASQNSHKLAEPQKSIFRLTGSRDKQQVKPVGWSRPAK
jgi:pilus assembly protein CpaC